MSYLALMTSQNANLSKIFPDLKGEIVQTKDPDIFLKSFRELGEQIVVIDRKVAGKQFVDLLKEIMDMEGARYAILFNTSPKDIEHLSRKRLANLEIFPGLPDSETVKFFIEKLIVSII